MNTIEREPSRLAVLGAGHVGPVIARLAVKAGYPVAIATSGDPEDIALITELVIPGARPRWASEAAAEADIVVLALPLHRFGDLDPARLDGKLVVDAMNYWPASDGTLEPFEEGGSSEIVARRLAGSTTSAITSSRTGRGRPATRTGGPQASRATTRRRSPRSRVWSTGSATTRFHWKACGRAGCCSRAARCSESC
jgi:hypothetical protein